MKDMKVKEFCRQYAPCDPGVQFAKHFSTMHEVYAALLRGEPAQHEAVSWLGWILNKQGIIPPAE